MAVLEKDGFDIAVEGASLFLAKRREVGVHRGGGSRRSEVILLCPSQQVIHIPFLLDDPSDFLVDGRVLSLAQINYFPNAILNLRFLPPLHLVTPSALGGMWLPALLRRVIDARLRGDVGIGGAVEVEGGFILLVVLPVVGVPIGHALTI